MSDLSALIDEMSQQNSNNIVPYNFGDCRGCKGLQHCKVCSCISGLLKQAGVETLPIGTPITLDRKRYIIRQCKTREDGLTRFTLSRETTFFVEVLFTYMCSGETYVFQRYCDAAPSVNKHGHIIRKTILDKGARYKCKSLMPEDVRMSKTGTIMFDPAPFVSLHHLNRRDKGRSSEGTFVSLLLNYCNANPDNIDIVGSYYSDSNTINSIKSQMLSQGHIHYTRMDYLNLIPISDL